MTQNHISLLIFSLAILLPYCGGNALKVGQPWNPKEEKFFDNGIDIIDNPNSAFGQWGFQQESAMDGRAQLSDYVAVVEITAIKTVTSAENVEAKHIEVKVKKTLYGTHPDSVLSLKSDPSFPGFVLIKRYEKRLKGNFILFSRWFNETINGPTAQGLDCRFHLSPASPVMIKATKDRLTTRVTLETKHHP
jgi:hypothetical protein